MVIVEDENFSENSDNNTDGFISDDKLAFFKPNQTYIGVLHPYSNGDKLKLLTKKI